MAAGALDRLQQAPARLLPVASGQGEPARVQEPGVLDREPRSLVRHALPGRGRHTTRWTRRGGTSSPGRARRRAHRRRRRPPPHSGRTGRPRRGRSATHGRTARPKSPRRRGGGGCRPATPARGGEGQHTKHRREGRHRQARRSPPRRCGEGRSQGGGGETRQPQVHRGVEARSVARPRPTSGSRHPRRRASGSTTPVGPEARSPPDPPSSSAGPPPLAVPRSSVPAIGRGESPLGLRHRRRPDQVQGSRQSRRRAVGRRHSGITRIGRRRDGPRWPRGAFTDGRVGTRIGGKGRRAGTRRSGGPVRLAGSHSSNHARDSMSTTRTLPGGTPPQ